MRKGSYWIGFSILVSTSNFMAVGNAMPASMCEDTVGDNSLESVNELSEGYLISIDSIASKGIGRMGRGAMRESSAQRMMEEAIGVRSIDESLSIGRIYGLWRRYLDRLLVLTWNESWSCLERERSRCRRSRIGWRKQIRTTMIRAIRMFAMISTKNRTVVVIKVLMTMPIAPMRAKIGSANMNLGSTLTAQTVKINGSC